MGARYTIAARVVEVVVDDAGYTPFLVDALGLVQIDHAQPTSLHALAAAADFLADDELVVAAPAVQS